MNFRGLDKQPQPPQWIKEPQLLKFPENGLLKRSILFLKLMVAFKIPEFAIDANDKSAENLFKSFVNPQTRVFYFLMAKNRLHFVSHLFLKPLSIIVVNSFTFT